MRRTLFHILHATFFLLSVSGGWSRLAHGADEVLAVIVHPSVPVQSLSAAELRSIYRRETRFWSDGTPIVPLALMPKNDLRVQFDKAVLGMDADGVAKFWIDQRVRGLAQPPRSVPTLLLVAKVVGGLPGSIAYLPQSHVPAGVHTVALIRDGRVVHAQLERFHFAGSVAQAASP